MATATDRLKTELHFHDRQARARWEYFAASPEKLRFESDDYLRHETWVGAALGLLGDLAGRRVLDYGCGHGMASVVLARRGAAVTAFDLSPLYLAEAGARARMNGVRVEFVHADAEALPFADGSFDAVWGSAVLHHLDLSRAARELTRVLRPGGLAVFAEPWGENPVLDLARRRLPYPGKERSPDERPLRAADVGELRRHFGRVDLFPFQLLGMARRLWPAAPFLAALDRCDAALLRHWPGVGRWCRYMVLSLREPRRL
jgi:SAM-dependent methyltransferase